MTHYHCSMDMARFLPGDRDMGGLMHLLVAIVTILPILVESCPLSCVCDFPSKETKCQNIGSLESITKSVQPGTITLIIEQGSFSKIVQSDFSQLPSKQINNLVITRGYLDELFDNAFAEIALSLRKLDLSDNRIRAIGEGAFLGLENLQELLLSRNRLAYLPQNIFKPLTSLQELNLGYNQYTNNFPSNVFTAQTNLQALTLDGNRLGKLKSGMFQGLQNLQSLHVSNCMITTIETDVFAQLTTLVNMDLSNNQLYALPPPDSFSSLRNIRNLTLYGNSLPVISQDQFKGLSLDTLDLTQNRINQLHPDAFRGMGSVRYLHLSENNLVSFPERVFKPIGKNLYSLKLNGNRGLSVLPLNLFNDLQTIRDINMSFCGLKRLQDQHFAKVSTLQQLDLSYNRLEYLPSRLLEQANFMTKLKIENNPWHCDCLIKHFRDWLQYPRSSTIIGCNINIMSSYNGNSGCRKPTCSTPTTLMYREIYMLPDNVLNDSCGKLGASQSAVQIEVIIGVIAAIVLVILIIILIACCLYRRHKKGEPLLCTDPDKTETISKPKHKKKKEFHKNEYFEEKKEKRRIDADGSSLNESDKSFVVRNFFHSMVPDPDTESQGTQSMTRKDSIESLSNYDYGSRHGSRHSSQYSLNTAYRIESAV